MLRTDEHHLLTSAEAPQGCPARERPRAASCPRERASDAPSFEVLPAARRSTGGVTGWWAFCAAATSTEVAASC